MHEQLWHVTACEPLGISIDDLRYIGRFSLDGDLTGPCQCWAPRLTRFQVWAAIDRHLLFTQPPDHTGGQGKLRQDHLLLNHLLPSRRAPRPEDPARLVRPPLPR